MMVDPICIYIHIHKCVYEKKKKNNQMKKKKMVDHPILIAATIYV